MSSSPTKQQTPTILSFLKAPRIGYVKTRLAKSIGQEYALRVYRTLVERQLGQTPPGYPLEIYFTPKDTVSEMRNWLGDKYEFHPQCPGRLGTRLARAVIDAFERGAKSVICIGGDCPKLDCTYFERTTAALREGSDVVFGPSEDGGYYLIGLQRMIRELFVGINWGTSQVRQQTIEIAEQLNLKVAFCGKLSWDKYKGYLVFLVKL